MASSQQGDIMGLLNAQGAYKNQDSPQKESKDFATTLKDMISEQIKIAIGEKQEDSEHVTKAVLNDGRRVLLIKRSEYCPRFANQWDLPGGHIHVGEEKEKGLEREIKEETGLCIEGANELYSSGDETFYIADMPDAPIKLSEEHTEYKMVDIDEIGGYDDLSPKYKDVILTAMEDAPLSEGRTLSENSQDFMMYHSTSPENVDDILSQGLKVGRENVHTQAGEWADEHYGDRPIYLSRELGKYEGAPLAVNTEGIFLVADLPALAGEHGANVEEETLWWNPEEEPAELEPYLEDGEIQIFDLLNDEDVIQAAINTTGTAAVLDNISPERIKAASNSNRLSVENVDHIARHENPFSKT
jgi:8-oxo-dGTP pyrophosphatase MutT (NUDIX family)